MTADTTLDEKVELEIEEGVAVVDTKSGELYTVGAVLDDGSVVCVGVRDRRSCALSPVSLSVVKSALEWETVGDPAARESVEDQRSTDEAPVTESTEAESEQEGAQGAEDGDGADVARAGETNDDS